MCESSNNDEHLRTKTSKGGLSQARPCIQFDLVSFLRQQSLWCVVLTEQSTLTKQKSTTILIRKKLFHHNIDNLTKTHIVLKTCKVLSNFYP